MGNKISRNQLKTDKSGRGEMLPSVIYIYINQSCKTGPLVIWYLLVFALVRQAQEGKKVQKAKKKVNAGPSFTRSSTVVFVSRYVYIGKENSKIINNNEFVEFYSSIFKKDIK